MEGHVRQQQALGRRASFEVCEPLGRADHLCQDLGAQERRRETDGFELQLQLAMAAGDARERLLQHRVRLLRILLAGTGRPHQRQRRLRSLDLVGRRF